MWIQRKSSRNTQKICINTRRKIRGNFCAKHFGFLAIFRDLFNKQAIIIRVFQYFLLFFFFFLVSCDMFCIICQRSSGVGFFRFWLPGACVVWCWLLYCRAKPDQVSAKNLRFKTINDTNVTIPAALRIQIWILTPTHKKNLTKKKSTVKTIKLQLQR